MNIYIYIYNIPPLYKKFLKTMFSPLKILINTHFKNLEVGVKKSFKNLLTV